jgi:hypothetical protein
MNELARKVKAAIEITTADWKTGLHFIPMALSLERYMAFRTMFSQYEYIIMSSLMIVPAMFLRETKCILQQLHGIKLVSNEKETLDKDSAIAVVLYINNIVIATKGSI